MTDAFTNADYLFQQAKSKGVRLLPLVPTKDERPFAGVRIILSGFLFFGVLVGGLGMVMGAWR